MIRKLSMEFSVWGMNKSSRLDRNSQEVETERCFFLIRKSGIEEIIEIYRRIEQEKWN